MSEPWERLTGEDDRAYEAFTRYRDLPPHQRSIRNAAIHQYNYRRDNGQLKTLHELTAPERRRVGAVIRSGERNSVAHEWVNRARLWDEHLDHIRRAEHIEAIREMSLRHAGVGRALVGAAIEALNETLRGTSRRMIGLPEDRVVLAFAAEGAKLERAAYGLNTYVDEVDGRQATPQHVPREILDTSPEVAAAAARLALAQAMARRNGAKEITA